MQSARSESRARRVWLLGAAVLCAAQVALWLRPPAPQVYTRYLSPPLPDGTSYTFLHPAWMEVQSVTVGGGGIYIGERPLQFAGPAPPPTASLFQKATHVLRLVFVRERGQDAFVLVWNSPLKVFKGPDERKEQRWERNGTLRHNIFIADARTKMKFFLFHNGPASARTRFEEIDPVITRSFRLLPPGAPVPSP